MKYVSPLLWSPIVNDVAFGAILRLASCVAPPLCNWATDIAAALRVVTTKEGSMIWELTPLIGEGEDREKPSIGLFQRVVTGLSISCKGGPLPADTFTFIFPVFCLLCQSSSRRLSVAYDIKLILLAYM